METAFCQFCVEEHTSRNTINTCDDLKYLRHKTWSIQTPVELWGSEDEAAQDSEVNKCIGYKMTLDISNV